MDTTALLSRTLDIGEEMLRSGAEVYRVEDSVERMLRAYGAEKVHVFTIPSVIITTVRMPGEEPMTQTRRIHESESNFSRLAQLNALCRKTCRDTPAPEVTGKSLEEILAQKPYSATLLFFIYAMVSFSFAVFFGGNFADGAASAVGGCILFLMLRVMNKVRIPSVFTHLGGAAVTAACALLMTHLGVGAHVDKIVIGNIMLLIPGIELTNGMRDLFSGDILAGLLHICEAIFLATMTALGAAYILSLGGMV